MDGLKTYCNKNFIPILLLRMTNYKTYIKILPPAPIKWLWYSFTFSLDFISESFLTYFFFLSQLPRINEFHTWAKNLISKRSYSTTQSGTIYHINSLKSKYFEIRSFQIKNLLHSRVEFYFHSYAFSVIWMLSS